RLPLFVRDDSLLPFGPELQHVGERPWDRLLLQVRVGEAAELTLPLPEGGALRARAGRQGAVVRLELETPRPLAISAQVPAGEFGVTARAAWHGRAERADWSRRGGRLVAEARVDGRAAVTFL